jgi:hypothetical protein
MKKIVPICAAASAIILLTFAAGVAMVSVENRQVDFEGRRYAGASIAAIVSRWDPDALVRRASGPMCEALGDGATLARTFDRFRLLGLLRSLDEVRGGPAVAINPDGHRLVTAEYVARAEFEHGTAQIRLSLIKTAGTWHIVRFGLVSATSGAHPMRGKS